MVVGVVVMVVMVVVVSVMLYCSTFVCRITLVSVRAGTGVVVGRWAGRVLGGGEVLLRACSLTAISLVNITGFNYEIFVSKIRQDNFRPPSSV